MRGSRFASPVSLSGHSSRAAASWARSWSTSASIASSPSGAATAAWKRAGIRAGHARQVARALRPDVRDRLLLVENPERPDEDEVPHQTAGAGRRVRRESGPHRRRHEVRPSEPRRLEEVLDGEDPVELGVEQIMAFRPRKPGDGRDDHPPPLGEPIEERRPSRKPADPGEKADRLARAFLPDPAAPSVDLDRPRADSCRPPGSSRPFPAHCSLASGNGCASDSGSAWGTARCWDGIGLGHQWFSHSSSKMPEICGMTSSAKSFVL